MRFDIPRGEMLEIRRADIVFDPAPHPYEVEHAKAIETNWLEEVARKPALFDGTVMLFSQVEWKAGRLEARCHAIRFATFLHWRLTRDAVSAEHLYAHAMPVSSDGALIAIRMGGHTVNAGRVYFAAGSLDADDVKDGGIDLAHNMIREVLEETGVDISGCRSDPAFHGYSSNRGTVIVRRYYLDEPAEAVADRIRRFIRSESEPEIADAVVIRSGDDLPEQLMPHMPPLIGWHFATYQGRGSAE